VSAAPLPEKEGLVMNPTTPKPDGSTRLGNLNTDLVAACLPGETCTPQWAYGMPLSYVHEMASHWLSLYDQASRPSPAPASDGNRDADSQTGDG